MSAVAEPTESREQIRIRTDLTGLDPYRPGRRPEDLAGTQQADPLVRLASNELPFRPLPGVQRAIVAALDEVHRYPDFFSRSLVSTLADRLGVDPATVVVDDGSSALCLHVIEAVCDPGTEVVVPYRSFDLYARAATRCGAIPVSVPLDGGVSYDLAAMARAVTPRTRAVVICNPNNPTGSGVAAHDLVAFAKSLPSDVLLLVDEAYREFVGPEGRRPDAVPLVGTRPTAVLRTFSKAYGLAGLRVGYAVTSPLLAEVLRKLAAPFAVSNLAERAAQAALAETTEVERRVSVIRAERARVITRLQALGLPMVPSQGNFVWIILGEASAFFAAECEQQGVLVRPFPPDGVRVTIGTTEQNDRFLAAAAVALHSVSAGGSTGGAAGGADHG